MFRQLSKLALALILLPAAVWAQSIDIQRYDFQKKLPGGSLTAATPATITLTSAIGGCPRGIKSPGGVWASLYISGGSGAAEVVTPGSGTCTGGAASGTIVFTPANSHSGAWGLTSASGGLQEAAFDIQDAQSPPVNVTAPLTLLADIALPALAAVSCDGGIISTGAHTLTINGPFVAADRQCFDTTGGGFVALPGYGGTFNPTWWGANGDGQIDSGNNSMATGGACHTLNVSSNPFTPSDVGKGITVTGALAGPLPLVTTISGFTNAGQVTLAGCATLAASNVVINWGYNNWQSWQAAIDGAMLSGNKNRNQHNPSAQIQADGGTYYMDQALSTCHLSCPGSGVVPPGAADVALSIVGSQLTATVIANTSGGDTIDLFCWVAACRVEHMQLISNAANAVGIRVRGNLHFIEHNWFLLDRGVVLETTPQVATTGTVVDDNIFDGTSAAGLGISIERNTTFTVDVSGSTVTAHTSGPFLTDGSWDGLTLEIAGVSCSPAPCTVDHVSSSTQLTLKATPSGTVSNASATLAVLAPNNIAIARNLCYGSAGCITTGGSAYVRGLQIQGTLCESVGSFCISLTDAEDVQIQGMQHRGDSIFGTFTFQAGFVCSTCRRVHVDGMDIFDMQFMAVAISNSVDVSFSHLVTANNNRNCTLHGADIQIQDSDVTIDATSILDIGSGYGINHIQDTATIGGNLRFYGTAKGSRPAGTVTCPAGADPQPATAGTAILATGPMTYVNISGAHFDGVNLIGGTTPTISISVTSEGTVVRDNTLTHLAVIDNWLKVSGSSASSIGGNISDLGGMDLDGGVTVPAVSLAGVPPVRGYDVFGQMYNGVAHALVPGEMILLSPFACLKQNESFTTAAFSSCLSNDGKMHFGGTDNGFDPGTVHYLEWMTVGTYAAGNPLAINVDTTFSTGVTLTALAGSGSRVVCADPSGVLTVGCTGGSPPITGSVPATAGLIVLGDGTSDEVGTDSHLSWGSAGSLLFVTGSAGGVRIAENSSNTAKAFQWGLNSGELHLIDSPDNFTASSGTFLKFSPPGTGFLMTVGDGLTYGTVNAQSYLIRGGGTFSGTCAVMPTVVSGLITAC